MIDILATIALAWTGEVPVYWTGEHSRVESKALSIIASQEEWAKTWTRNSGKAEGVPQIDFSKGTVLAMFGGKVGQQAGYSLVESFREGGKLVLRYAPRYFSVAMNWTNDPVKMQAQIDSFKRTPYAFFLLPKDVRVVRLEEGIVRDKILPPNEFRFIKELSIPDEAGRLPENLSPIGGE